MIGGIRFLLNDSDVLTDVAPGTLALDFLRRDKRLVGTKEGCKEGDCGACVVLVGELFAGGVEYHPVTSCLLPLGELHGKHLVTIEGLNRHALSPVQQAIVDTGGSQCGFCTPGIVMSLTGFLLDPETRKDARGCKNALGGNLCRCTGYASLIRAGRQVLQKIGGNNIFTNEFSENATVQMLIEQQVLPAYFQSIPARLKNIPAKVQRRDRATPYCLVAGGTDLYVQKGDALANLNVHLLSRQSGLKQIKLSEKRVHIGPLTTFEAFARHPIINQSIPDIQKYSHYNASWQVRNRATIGGNIINASPIGDMTALLLALESDLVFRAGRKQRTVALKSFFTGYKLFDKAADEILTDVIFPVPDAGSKINFEKVSKRQTLDIATVNSGIKIVADGALIRKVELSMGGVAPIPLFLKKTCDFLRNKRVMPEYILQANDIAQSEISPISDVRGSSEYKRLLVRQLLIAHFTKLFPELIQVRAFYEAH